MPTKQESILLLAAQTARDITCGGEVYMSFLTTAANNFKYSFRDQLLIFAQKPEATACGEIAFWNQHGRWVNRGTTGIALLKDTEAPYKLRYVFDMSDTNSHAGRTVPVWQMRPQDESAVIEALANRYGTAQDGMDLMASLLGTAKIVAEDNLADYLTSLCEVKAGSLLEELDADNTEVWFRGLLENSIAYMMLIRCGIDAREQFGADDFSRIVDFNTPETISILGTAASDISEMVLREIAATVLDRQRQEARQRAMPGSEPNRVPAVRELYEHYKAVIATAVSTDEAYRNACRNSDRETALLEGNAAIRRAVTGSADTQLMKLYYDMASFHNRIHREVLDETYPVLAAAPHKEEVAEIWDGEEDERPPWGVEIGCHSPWGEVQTSREIADGVFEISTARHGGIVLRESNAEGIFSAEILARAGKEYGWLYFEEDAEAPLMARELRDRGLLAAFEEQRKTSGRDSVANREKEVYAESRKENSERSGEHGTDLSQRGRLPSAELDRAGGPGAGQVRDAAAQLSAGASEWDLHGDAAIGQAGRAPDGDRPAGPRDGGESDAADGAAAGRDGGAESGRPDEMDGADEQHQGGSGGNGAERAGLQLTDALPTEAEQKQEIARAEDDKSSAFVISQEDIDAVLLRGGSVSDGKYRIYEQFLKRESMADNAAFLKKEYGTGGAYPAISGRKLNEWHDPKGIRISTGGIIQPDAELTLPWRKAAKRIGELIAADRYLNRAEKESYPAYLAQVKQRKARWALAEEIQSVIKDYVDFKTQLGEKEQCAEVMFARRCADCFGAGEKKCYVRTGEGSFVLPTLRDAMQTIIRDNTHLTGRCEAVLAQLSGPLAAPLEPTYDELNPPPPPKKEYRFSLGDTVYLGAQEYSLIAFNEKAVRLYDPTFPLINKEMERTEFDKMLAENPLNDHLAQIVEDAPEPSDTETPEESATPQESTVLTEAKRLIQAYCQEEFEQGADFSDLSHVALAHTTTSDNEYPIEISADLVRFRLVSQVNGQDTVSLQCHDLDDLNQYLANLDFDEMAAYAEDEYQRQQNEKNAAEPKPEQEAPPPSEGSRVDEMLRQAELANRLYEQTGQAVFGFEVGKEEPVNQTSDNPPQAGETQYDSERFTVIETEVGYAVWDEAQNGIHTDKDGVQQNFTSEWQAEDYLKQVRAEAAEKEPNQKSEPVKLHSIVIDLTPRGDRESEREQEPPAPPMARPREKLPPLLLYPEIPSAERHMYRITDEHLGEGGAKTKFKANLAAIETLKRIEDENRLATPEEQEILARYVGWGGLPQAFDAENAAWSNEYTQLHAALTEDEYNAARASTLNAHYTSPVVVKAIYKAVENLSFRTGNILEPSCGIGNFFGLMPESMAASKLYGVELDSITGRIARQLYQNASIAVQGFEKTELPDSFFDLAIGNVPFGNYSLSDKRYDKNHFLIHDYFFARALDKVRPGGIIAFVTSKGTMDKANSTVRKYIAQRAELLGAIRLPNNAFLANAGTQVTADILFLQKRDRLTAIEPEWVHLGKTDNGLPINQYFLDHSEMVLGEMTTDDRMYGDRSDTTCKPFEGKELKELLADAVGNICGEIREYTLDDPEAEESEDRSIPADPSVRNFSYTVVDGKIYYRENSRMNPVDVSVTAGNRIRELIAIRECVRTLIEYQLEDWSDEAIRAKQQSLNTLYDAFVKKYGRITSRANKSTFEDDSAYFLLSSLEVLNDEGNFVRKADMFTKRTIRQKVEITHVDTASEALAVSLAEKACVDLGYMASLIGDKGQITQIVDDLKGVIFKDPASGPFDLESEGAHWAQGWQTADEYLSGNVRQKLADAKQAAETNSFFTVNVQALEQVQPPDLTVGEISVRLGATWIPPDVVEQFVYELFGTPAYTRWKIHVHYSQHTGEWNVEGKSADKGNIRAYNTYGTDRINGYKIVEETLNLRDVRIFDYDENRNSIFNKKETAIAQAKQTLIKQAFLDWIWKNPERRERLCRLYNEKFNSKRPREYDGSHIDFVGMNPEITLRKHQINAIAHILYGGNTLLAHCVGAGKTYEMTAAAQESKRLGLCQKSLFVVPNHLTEQWASEYLQLYPSANILVATRKDFEAKRRKRFCGRIATGDYDAVIIGHSQFEKIPMSAERQIDMLTQQKKELIDGIEELKHNNGERFSIKQMEKSKKSIEAKLAKLNDQSRKDNVVTFEELGIDRIFIDEAHYYKNLAAFSKMRNVGGISQTEAQKSSDLYMKCRYLDELTGGRGIVFATGTPISNTMVEMYTMQKYLQYDALKEQGLLNFDAWASTFGETVTAIELAPEGYTFSRR